MRRTSVCVALVRAAVGRDNRPRVSRSNEIEKEERITGWKEEKRRRIKRYPGYMIDREHCQLIIRFFFYRWP